MCLQLTWHITLKGLLNTAASAGFGRDNSKSGAALRVGYSEVEDSHFLKLEGGGGGMSSSYHNRAFFRFGTNVRDVCQGSKVVFQQSRAMILPSVHLSLTGGRHEIFSENKRDCR